jgi:arylsulfatase A-like enzyme
MKIPYPILILLAAFLLSCNTEKTEEALKPNIILIMADDLGMGLLSHEGQEIIQTPHIDKLATEGISFTNAYSAMLCAPSRAALITGLHDCHAEGFEITNSGIYKDISTGKRTREEIENLIDNTLSPIPEDAPFIAKIAKEAGYTTAQFGKLEWGFAASHQQMEAHGWDYYFGYLDHTRAHGFYPPFLFENGNLVTIEGNTRPDCGKTKEPETQAAYNDRWDMEGKKVYSQNLFMERILQFISDNKDRPFFLYFPTQLPHGPVSVPEVHADFIDNDSLTQIEKEYASMVKMLDDNVGQIMNTLKSLGMDENTVVIFSSDNGHEIYYTQKGRILKPYRNMKTGEVFDNFNAKYYSKLGGDVFNGNNGRAGLKRSNLQGGIEVPLFIRWPNKIKAGQENSRLVANYDLLATIAEMTGNKATIKTDGLSFYPELVGKEPTQEHEFIVYSSFYGPTLITNDGWKIRTYLPKEAFELYYLPDDYREENNLANNYPEKLAKLKDKLLNACDGDFTNGWYRGRNQISLTN